MKNEENIKIKCKHCQTTLTTEIKFFQTCGSGKVMLDINKVEFYVRIIANEEDYGIIS